MSNPETGVKEQRIKKGFYRQLHEAYYDLNFSAMSVSQLVKKARTLEEQLKRAKLEKEARMAPLIAQLPPPQLSLDRAVSHQQNIVSSAGTFTREMSPSAETQQQGKNDASDAAQPLLPPKLEFTRYQTAA